MVIILVMLSEVTPISVLITLVVLEVTLYVVIILVIASTIWWSGFEEMFGKTSEF